MSAFLVDKKHIDFLVTAAVRYVNQQHTILYFGNEQRLEGDSHKDDADRKKELSAIGEVLWQENWKSYLRRYAATTLPGDGPKPYRFERFGSALAPIAPVAVLKAIDCLTYQSCEHEGWGASAAKNFLDALQSAYIGRLPGYDAAAWAVSA